MAKIIFVQGLWYEYFGTMALSAFLKREGHWAKIMMDGWSKKRLIRDVLQEKPTAVAFSTLTGNFAWSLDLARGLKVIRPNLTVLFGGIHATLCPEIVREPSIDAVCRGEGDETLVEVANALDAAESLDGIRNLSLFREGKIVCNEIRPLIQDLDKLPFVDRTVYLEYPFFQKYQIIQMMTGRGCPFRCSYCHNHIQQRMYKNKGTYVRQRSVDSVIEEIKEIRDRYPYRRLVGFNDDVLWMDYDWLFAFLERYGREIGLPFGCTMTPRRVNEEVIQALKEAGLAITGLAFETGDERVRKDLLRKPVSNEEYREAAALLHRYKIPFTTGTILALPGESLRQAMTSLELNWKMKPIFPWSSLFQPYPGIDLTRYAEEQGLVGSGAYHDIGESFYNKSLLKQPDRNRMDNLQKLYFLAVRFPRWFPLIRKLIEYPPNPLFKAIFVAGYGYYLKRIQHLTWKQIFTHGCRFLVSTLRYQAAERRIRRERIMPPSA